MILISTYVVKLVAAKRMKIHQYWLVWFVWYHQVPPIWTSSRYVLYRWFWILPPILVLICIRMVRNQIINGAIPIQQFLNLWSQSFNNGDEVLYIGSNFNTCMCYIYLKSWFQKTTRIGQCGQYYIVISSWHKTSTNTVAMAMESNIPTALVHIDNFSFLYFLKLLVFLICIVSIDTILVPFW